uniref:putative signal transducing protein n=1 Tax=uncultured Draconibacterium sp. TaxID=1573823 RepID=UPI003216D6EA
MNNPVTVATFTSNFDMKYMLFKEMLEEAGIKYMLVNEITSTIDGTFKGSPSNIGIEIRVLEENVEEALEIFNSIKE